jgi:hypothetical protein
MAVMARIWKEPWDSSTSRHAVDWSAEGIVDWSPDAIAPIEAHKKNPTLVPHESVFVNVCSFTFRFESLPQLERVIAYFEQKILPSSIIPAKEFLDYGGDSGEAQRWYERLPLFLREEPKRQKVVKALRGARAYFDGTG